MASHRTNQRASTCYVAAFRQNTVFISLPPGLLNDPKPSQSNRPDLVGNDVPVRRSEAKEERLVSQVSGTRARDPQRVKMPVIEGLLESDQSKFFEFSTWATRPGP